MDESYESNSKAKHIQYTITDLLEPGDVYGDTITVGNYKVPSKFKQLFVDSFKTNFILIGVIDSTIRNNKSTSNLKSKNGNRYYNALYFDKIQAKFLEVKAQFNVASHEYKGESLVRFKDVKNFTVIKTLDISDIYNINNDYFIYLKSANCNRVNANQIKLSSMPQKEIDRLFEDKSQYDLSGNTAIIKIADTIYSKGIIHREQITAEIFSLISKTDLLKNANITLNKLSKDKVHGDIIKLEFCNSSLIQYKCMDRDKFDRDIHYYAIVDNKTSMSSKKVLFESAFTIEQILQYLYIIGEYRYKVSKVGECRIHNDKINIDNFLCIITVMDDNNKMIKYNIALDKANGDTYIIGEYCDMDFYKLFRFKRLEDA